jgi:hypothetical protein
VPVEPERAKARSHGRPAVLRVGARPIALGRRESCTCRVARSRAPCKFRTPEPGELTIATDPFYLHVGGRLDAHRTEIEKKFAQINETPCSHRCQPSLSTRPSVPRNGRRRQETRTRSGAVGAPSAQAFGSITDPEADESLRASLAAPHQGRHCGRRATGTGARLEGGGAGGSVSPSDRDGTDTDRKPTLSDRERSVVGQPGEVERLRNVFQVRRAPKRKRPHKVLDGRAPSARSSSTMADASLMAAEPARAAAR